MKLTQPVKESPTSWAQNEAPGVELKGLEIEELPAFDVALRQGVDGYGGGSTTGKV